MDTKYLSRQSISEIKGLESLTNLQKLYLSNNSITEIKGLESLTNLQLLWLDNNSIAEIKGLEFLTNIQELYLSNNKISDIKGLKSLTNLQELYLSCNSITEIKGLESLTNLQVLYLSNNSITEINGLESLTNLQILGLSGNSITEIKGLESLTNLQLLWLDYNKISEIKGVESLTNLQELYLSCNKISEIKGVESLTNLQELGLYNNSITEIKGLESLTNLQKLYLSNNSISEIPIELLVLRQLTCFDCSFNPIEHTRPIIRRFIDRVNRRNFNTNTIYNDGQNVHDSTIQKSIQKSIFQLLKRSLNGQTIDSVLNQVLGDTILTQKTKCLIGEYCTDLAIHSILQITFTDLFISVWSVIQNHTDSLEIKNILNTELQDAECQCFTGRMSRLVNCLNGFDPEVQVYISDKSQISNIIIMAKERLENAGLYSIEKHRLEARKELVERGYDLKMIDEFVGYIE